MFYTKAYNDISHLTNSQAIDHYNRFGKNEGRIFDRESVFELLPSDFDSNYYKSKYPDLSTCNEEQLITHYIHHGIKENRKYCVNIEENREHIITSNKNTLECNEIVLRIKSRYGFCKLFFSSRLDYFKLIGKYNGKIEFIFSLVPNLDEIIIPLFGEDITLLSDHKLSLIDIKFYDLVQRPIKFQKNYVTLVHIHGEEAFLSIKNRLLELSQESDLVITISNHSLIPLLGDLTNEAIAIIPVVNGSDINGFIKALFYIPDVDILFFHTKSNDISRNKWLDILTGTPQRRDYQRKFSDKGCVGIEEEFIDNDKNPECFVSNLKYIQILTDMYSISYERKHLKFFGGTFLSLSKKIISFLKQGDLHKMYVYLCPNKYSVDVNWYSLNKKLNLEEAATEWYKCKDHGNPFCGPGVRDGCFPHAFERFLGYITSHLDMKFIGMSEKNLIRSNNIIPTAIYFPQFHAFEENDKFWGKGFTEWTFLKQTVPLLSNDVIYHPRDGYYDLNDIETRKHQSVLAEKGGIEAFCYYHYWFSGKKVMYTALEKTLREGYPSQKFYLSWANEPWSRRWDGITSELLAQEYGNEKNWANHFFYLEKFFSDPRYLKIDNCPLFGILRIGHILCFKQMFECWNKIAIKMGYSGIKIVGFLTSFSDSLKVYDYSEIMLTTERQPSFCNLMVSGPATNSMKQINYTNYKNIFQLRTGKQEYDEETYLHFNLDIDLAVKEGKLKNGYQHFMNVPEDERLSRTLPFYYLSDEERWKSIENLIPKNPQNHFRGTFVHWNNTPRNRGNPLWKATIHYDFSIEKFTQHLVNMFNIILEEKEKNMIYPFLINAWNEWNEQSILEPNNVNGDDILMCVANALKIFD